MERVLLGSVAGTILKSARCPVIVCGAHPIDLARWRSSGPVRLAVGLDATRASRAALAWTGALPESFTRTVSVVRCYWPPQEAGRYGIDAEASANGPADLLHILERDARRELPSSVELEAGALHFREAHINAAEVLADSARALGADAVIVGVPRHGLEKWDAIDARAVVRAAHLPVICVPEAVHIAQPAEEIPDYRSVLVASDLSDPSNHAVAKAYGLLKSTGGRVELCHVHERRQFVHPTLESPLGPVLTDEQRAEVEGRLRALIPARAAAFGIETSVSIIEAYAAGDAILQNAKRLGVDVIVMASHGRSGIKRALLGSVAEGVVRHARIPVLVVHQPAQ